MKCYMEDVVKAIITGEGEAVSTAVVAGLNAYASMITPIVNNAPRADRPFILSVMQTLLQAFEERYPQDMALATEFASLSTSAFIQIVVPNNNKED